MSFQGIDAQTGEGRILRQPVRGIYSDRHAAEYSDMQVGEAEQAGRVKDSQIYNLKDAQTGRG